MKLTNEIEWISETNFRVGGQQFISDLESQQLRTSNEQVVVLKTATMLRHYLDFFLPHSIDNMIELGIWQGGSPLFFGLTTDIKKIVALDQIRPDPAPADASPELGMFYRNPAVIELIERHRLGTRVRPYFGYQQDDRAGLETIIADEFGDAPLDLVIDDASHQYEQTRRSFEILFPRLRQGGLYIIEDWQWAHMDVAAYQDGSKWGDRPALTNFIFELLMAYGSHSDLFWNIVVRDWFVSLQKGSFPCPEPFRIDEAIRARGKSLWLI